MNNITKLLIESSECDMEDEDLLDSVDDDIEDEFEDIEELDDDIEYTEEMVNVIQTSRSRCIIEYDNLMKLAESKDIDVDRAYERICEHYNISKVDTYVLIESYEDTIRFLEENAKKSCKGKVKDSIKKLKKKGVKLMKKKSKKK